MEQQKTPRNRSISVRLLFGVLSLIVVIVFFLNISAIFLIREDKQANVFHAKSTEALLAGNEFVGTARHVVSTLKLAISYSGASSGQAKSNAGLQELVDGQSDLQLILLDQLNTHTGHLTHLSWAVRQQKDSPLAGLERPEQLPISEEWIATILPDLKKSPIALLNLSRLDGRPVLAVLVADLAHASVSVEVPVAIGFVSLSDFASRLSAMDLTIATHSGWVLYDSDPAVLYSRANIASDPFFAFATAQEQLKQGAIPYESKGKKYLGSYSFPGFGLVVLSRADWAQAMAATYSLSEKFMLLGLMAIAAAIAFGVFFTRTLTSPLERLVKDTASIAEGNYGVTLVTNTHDEIANLAKSFSLMAGKIKELFDESVEKVLLESELDIASTVQQNLLPPTIYQAEGIDIFSYYQAASRCGGDWWGVFRVGHKIVIGIADATGHGLQCALMTATARSSFSLLNKFAEENSDFSYSPSEMLAFCNRAIFESASGKIMMTFFICVIDLEKLTLTYANAGHNPPWLFRQDSGGWQLRSLTGVGVRLGEGLDLMQLEEKTLILRSEDILFLYTDGLMETKNAELQMYGKKRMRTLVEAGLAKGADQVVDGLIADFLRYNEGKYLDDDVTIAAAAIHGLKSQTVGQTHV